jgi:hypothetical protein
MELRKESDAQRQRQTTRRTNGQYDKAPRCMCCGKSAGFDFLSDRRTDSTDSAGNKWGDIALVLCEKCGTKLDAMADAEAFALMQSKKQARKAVTAS